MRATFLLALLATWLTAAAALASGDGGAAAPPPDAVAELDSGGEPYHDLSKPKRPVEPKPRGRRKRPTPEPPSSTGYRFPVAGPFSWGGSGGRFGAGRQGHTHQGQDLSAPEGTPVLAPASGLVEAVQYQASGAGHYIVLDGADENRDYVFMHLRAGSITVNRGQSVRAGRRIGEVGNTGRSFGAHLHFEIWAGKGWYTGGRPIDPLPLLRAWAR